MACVEDRGGPGGDVALAGVGMAATELLAYARARRQAPRWAWAGVLLVGPEAVGGGLGFYFSIFFYFFFLFSFSLFVMLLTKIAEHFY